MKNLTLNRLSIIFCLVVFFSFPRILYASDSFEDQNRGGRIAVFRFQASGEVTPYGIIIPESLSKTLVNIVSADLALVPAESATVRTPSEGTTEKLLSVIPEADRKQYTFVITGECGGTGTGESLDELRIKVQITDLRNFNNRIIETTSDETGAVLKATIDRLTSEVVSVLDMLETAYLDSLEKPAPDRLKKPPYTGTYSALQGLSFGIDLGYTLFGSDWGDIYDNGKNVMTHITYRKNRYSGSLNYGYTSADASYKINMSIHSMTLNLSYSLIQSDYFDLDLSAGTGVARTAIWTEGDEYNHLFEDYADEKKSIDPLIECGLFMHIYLDSLIIRGGAGYRRIILDKDMSSITFYLGAGYRL